MKKIDVVVKYFYPIAAGIETNTLETYSVLSKMGWDITIHTSADTYLEKDSLKKEETIRGLKVKRYHFGSEFTGYSPSIDWENTDLVCLHNFNVSHFRILVKVLMLKVFKRKKFALVVTPHGGFNPEWSIYPWSMRIVKSIYQYTLGTLLMILVTDGLRAVSEWEKQEMIKKGIPAKKIRVITNGLEDEAYIDVEKKASKEVKAKVNKWGDYVVQVGRVYPIKNYETTIKALAKLKAKINYVIVGPVADEEYKGKLLSLATKLGVRKQIIFAGVVRGVDKYYIIKKARMMVHMALWESFCNVVHEGLSQGTLCIVANNTALPLLIRNGENGYVIDTHDSVSLANKIDYVLDNYRSQKIIKIQKESKKIGNESSWKHVASKMSDFYSDLVSLVKKQCILKK